MDRALFGTARFGYTKFGVYHKPRYDDIKQRVEKMSAQSLPYAVIKKRIERL